MARATALRLESVQSPEAPDSAFKHPDLQLWPDGSPNKALHFPSPQRAETPTPHLHFHRPMQWQDLRCSREALEGQRALSRAVPRSIFSERQDAMYSERLGSFGSPLKTGTEHQLCVEPRPLTPRHLHCKARIKRFRSSRSDSLNDEKVLYQTSLVRSQSTFQFLDNFVIEDEIGQSQHSKVFKVRHKSSGGLFALKRSANRLSSAQRQDRLHELMAVSRLPAHGNIVSYFRAWQQDKYMYIQMELCEGGSLAEQIQKAYDFGKGLDEQRIVAIFSDLSQGLEFLHEHHVLHLDIKPANLFLDADERCKIGDFGLAIQDEEKDWQEGDGAYLAPELLSVDHVPTAAADIYSAGATIFECCTGSRLPRGTQLEHIDLAVSCELRKLVLEMLEVDSSLRPTAAQVNRQIAAIFEAHPEWNAPMERTSSPEADTQDTGGERLEEDPPVLIDGLQMEQVQQTPCAMRPALAPVVPQSVAAATPSMSPLAPVGGAAVDSPLPTHPGAKFEDTAFCLKRPAREHWSRKAMSQAAQGATPELNKAPITAQIPGTQERPGPPVRHLGQPFTAMKSPFESLALQQKTSPPSLGRRYHKSSDMDDLQSTVRCLNMY